MTDREPVLVSVEDGVGIIELARPEKFNAMCERAVEIIDEATQRFERDNAIKSILIRAQGKNFCTGHDLSETSEFDDGSTAGESSERGHRVLQQFEASRLPVVVALQGLALAGGLEFMLAADIVFMGESARAGDQHAQFGLIPGWGGTQRLPRLVGLRRSLDLMFTARWLDAATALDWGLVNYVVPDAELQTAALDYCRKLATRNGEGLALMKRLARTGLEQTLSEGLAAEAAVIPDFQQSANATEGVAAFMEKRAPRFN